jgi:hypothetical protein
MPKWLVVVLQVAPVLIALVPGVPPILVPLIVRGITDAQQIKGASGADKKRHVLAIVADGITAVNAVKPGTIPDPAGVLVASGLGIDTTIATVNLIRALPGHGAGPE